MEKNKTSRPQDPLHPIFDDEITNHTIVSANEVTGMVPRPPLSEADVEGFLTLFPIEQQQADVAKKASGPAGQEMRSSVNGTGNGRNETAKPTKVAAKTVKAAPNKTTSKPAARKTAAKAKPKAAAKAKPKTKARATAR
jgi:cell division protein FtsN